MSYDNILTIIQANDPIGIVHLVMEKNFPKKQHFLPCDTQTGVCVSGGKKRQVFGNFVHLIDNARLSTSSSESLMIHLQ